MTLKYLDNLNSIAILLKHADILIERQFGLMESGRIPSSPDRTIW
mgnify:CR=1 FL=1